MKTVFTFLMLCCVAVVAAAGTALAQSAGTSSEVGVWQLLDPLRPLLTELVSVLVAALVGFLTVKLNKWLGLNIEARHREALHSALKNGALAGLSKVQAMTADKKIDVRSEIVAQALIYASQAAPDAIKHFGITPQRLREMIEAKLPEVAK